MTSRLESHRSSRYGMPLNEDKAIRALLVEEPLTIDFCLHCQHSFSEALSPLVVWFALPSGTSEDTCRGRCSFALIDAAYSTCRITCISFKDDNCLLRMGRPLLAEAPGAGLSSFFCYLRFEIQKGFCRNLLWMSLSLSI